MIVVTVKFCFHLSSAKWNRKKSQQSFLQTSVHRHLIKDMGWGICTAWLIVQWWSQVMFRFFTWQLLGKWDWGRL